MGPEAAVDAVSKMGTGVAAATEGGVAAGAIAPALEAAAMPEVAIPTTTPSLEQMSFADLGAADFVDAAATRAADSSLSSPQDEIQGVIDNLEDTDFDEATRDRLQAAAEAEHPESNDQQPVIGQPNDILNATRISGVPGEIPRVREPSLDTANPPTHPASREQANKSADQTGNDVVQPTEKPNDSSDAVPIETPTEANEPESLRDQLSARVDELQARENPTPEDQRELSKARLEIAERDRRDVLNAAEPDSLSAEDAAEKAELNEKYGKLNTEAAIENASPAAPATEVANEPIDPGEFNEQAIRDQIEADRNRKDWSQDQKDAYVNAQRADHEKKKADYEAAMKEKGEQQELTTEQQKQKLDNELKDLQDRLVNGDITSQEATALLNGNRRKRDLLVNSIVEKFKLGEDVTPFEKEVAEKSMEMQRLMLEIATAPKIMSAMETTIKKLKAEYKTATQFQITEKNANDPKTQENVALRTKLQNQIAAQAGHMARYADITAVNVNQFKSVNSDMMTLMGTRNVFANLFVKSGLNVVRRGYSFRRDITARHIAQKA